MVITFIYGENGECVLDTSFSLFFVNSMVERGLLSKDFISALAAGNPKATNTDDFMNMPYCCYLNANKDPMTKQEFDERFIVNFKMMLDIYYYVVLGDVTDSKMKNIFRVKPDPKKPVVKRHQDSGD